jgi:hypothetical protein
MDALWHNLNNIFYFIYGLFHDAVGSSDYIVPNDRLMEDEL